MNSEPVELKFKKDSKVVFETSALITKKTIIQEPKKATVRSKGKLGKIKFELVVPFENKGEHTKFFNDVLLGGAICEIEHEGQKITVVCRDYLDCNYMPNGLANLVLVNY